MTIQVFSATISERLKYTVSFVFERCSDILLEFSHTGESVIPGAAIIQYGGNPQDPIGYYIPASGLLGEKRIEQKWSAYFKTQAREDIKRFQEDRTSFDCLAAIFYLITRYEEYLKYRPDKHDRYTYRNSVLYMKGWTNRPIVDEWVEGLIDALNKKFRKSIHVSTRFELISSIDVDIPWKSKNRRWPYNWLDILQPASEDDPYDTFEWIKHWHDELGITPYFFFLVGGRSKYDPIQNFREWNYQEMIREIDRWARVGVHPSYESSDQSRIIKREKERLDKWLSRQVITSRQHYLKLKMPDTYQYLLECGIRADFSMGYAETIGFRSGTCHDYLWFDLGTNQETELRICPMHVMDVTLKQYMKLEPTAAFEKCRPLIDACKNYRGKFGLLWHNSSFSSVNEWEPWVITYRNILSYALK